MSAFEPIEILLAEDNPTDAELTMRALKKNNLANHLMWVKDGTEALDFVFCSGAYAGRSNGNPKLILLDLKLPIEVVAQAGFCWAVINEARH
jgi:CheY-like chemotaxis protein